MASNFMRSTAGRTIHIKVQPRPRTLADSKVVLDLIRQFGEVETFKHLKHEATSPAPNSFIAIFKEQRSATKAVDANYIEFEYNDQHLDNEAASAENAEQGFQERLATMAIREAGLNHESYIERQPYFAGFEHRHNALSEDMVKRFPNGFWAMAFLDYKLDEPESRTRRKWKSIFESRKKQLGEGGYMGIYERIQMAKKHSGTEEAEASVSKPKD